MIKFLIKLVSSSLSSACPVAENKQSCKREMDVFRSESINDESVLRAKRELRVFLIDSIITIIPICEIGSGTLSIR